MSCNFVFILREERCGWQPSSVLGKERCSTELSIDNDNSDVAAVKTKSSQILELLLHD